MRTLAWLSAGAALTAVLVSSNDATACGGCFQPPGETPTIVTDHRMILSISQEQTTLYDQIKYAGSPESFAWVLPYSGDIQVGLSADIVFGTLDQLSQTTILQPPLNCPGPPSSCFDGESDYASAPNAGGYADAGVAVLKTETVGPYQTVQLHSDDPAALQKWLGDNGYTIPDDVKSVVDAYVNEHFDFLALKLLPAKGVQDMRPVRVTTKGASPVLPLRMVAAGTGATVGITLWVVGEGRYEPTNFPAFHIADADLSWDWNTSKSNYTELRAQKTTELAGRGWEVESSLVLYRQQVENPVQSRFPQSLPDGGVGSDYAPITDSNGVITKSADEVRQEDMDTLFHGIPASSGRVTRLRSDVAHAALNVDLTLGATSDQSFLTNIRQVTKELNQPQCPVYTDCKQTGTAPRDQAAAQSGGGPETFSCNTSSLKRKSSWIAAGFAFVALAIGRTIRRRRR